MVTHLLARPIAQPSGALLGLLLACAPVSAQTFRFNMALESYLHMPTCTASDVWGFGNYAVVARMSVGFAVIDLRNPRSPRVANIKPPGYPIASGLLGIAAIKADNRYIYAADWNAGNGVLIYDTQPDPMNPQLVSTLGGIGHPTPVHNLWVDGNYLYAQNRVFDITDRANPRYLTEIGSAALTHDIVVFDDVAYLSNWTEGFALWDVSVPLLPRLIASHSYPDAQTHNLWPSDDRRYLYSTDENAPGGVGGVVRIWDLANLPVITQVGQYKAGPTSSVVHNVHVRDNLLFTSYYKEGVRVCSLADPENPVEIAFYDTYPSTGPGACQGPYTAGCWGVYPFRNDVLVAGDTDSGVYILRLNPIANTLIARSPLVAPGSAIELDFLFGNKAPVPLDSFALLLLISINGAPSEVPLMQNFPIVLQPEHTITNSLRIPLPAQLPTPLSVRFSSFTGLLSPFMISAQQDVTVLINR